MIKEVNGIRRYFDKNGIEISDGCLVKFTSGAVEKVYLTTEGELGTDATNRHWIETGRAIECEYGIYPLTHQDTDEVEVVPVRVQTVAFTNS